MSRSCSPSEVFRSATRLSASGVGSSARPTPSSSVGDDLDQPTGGLLAGGTERHGPHTLSALSDFPNSSGKPSITLTPTTAEAGARAAAITQAHVCSECASQDGSTPDRTQVLHWLDGP